MNELVNLIQEKAGISEEQATKAVEAMKEFISGKVPPMFSGFVDNFFASSKPDSSDSFLH